MLKQTIVSYPDRGPWGEGGYRGNTSGHLIKDLIETFMPTHVFDPMMGSDTTGDVCRMFKIPYLGKDLRDGFDIMSLIDRRKVEAYTREHGKFDFIFFHPPYWNMITYRQGNDKDFASGTYERFLARMHNSLTWLASLLDHGGRMALLIADLRRHGRTYFLSDDVTTPKIPGVTKEFRVIKVQHNTTSDGDVGLIGDVRMVHEYVTIWVKP